MERKLIAAAVSSALAVPMAAQAVEFAVSGHVNRAVIVVDEDDHPKDGDLQHVDSNASETRFRFKGTEELDTGMTVGANLELGRPGNWRTRHANVSLGGAAGKLTIGQAGTAASGAEDAGGAFNGGSWLAGVTNWCSYYSEGPACATDGFSRLEVLRYDLPIGPASIAVSAGNDEYYDGKLTIAGSMGDAGYDFRVGYWNQDDVADADAILTSGAVSFGQGTSLAVSWVKRDGGVKRNEDAEWDSAVVEAAAEVDDSAVYAFLDAVSSVSLETETFFATADHTFGDASFGVYWRKGEHTLSARNRSTGTTGSGSWDANLWGIGIGYNIGGGATAYAGYRHMEKDDVELAEDTNLFLTGMRVTFN